MLIVSTHVKLNPTKITLEEVGGEGYMEGHDDVWKERRGRGRTKVGGRRYGGYPPCLHPPIRRVLWIEYKLTSPLQYQRYIPA